MLRRNFYLFIAVFTIVLSGSLANFAQTAGLSGRVVLKNADNTTVPVEGAVVEVFRIDQKGANLEDKTSKKGDFTFVSLTLGGTYVLSVSGAGLSPALSQNLRPGASGLVIEVSAGDGRRLTEDEVKMALENSKTQTGELSAEDKKKKEEEDKALEAAKAKNAKAEAYNALVIRVLAEGNEAFNRENWDLAIVKYQEGVDANPEFAGSVPTLQNNKGQALTKRAVGNYNKMSRSTNADEKKELLPKVQQDFDDAISAFSKSWAVAQKAKPGEITDMKDLETKKATTLDLAQDTVRLMVLTATATEAKKDEVGTLMREYVSSETDKAKKLKAQLNFGFFLLKVYDYETAAVEFRKAVEMSPGNTDATGGLGLCLYTLTYEKNDPVRKQESLNYMQFYLDNAPKDHPLRDGIEGAVKDLMGQKLKPQKITAKN